MNRKKNYVHPEMVAMDIEMEDILTSSDEVKDVSLGYDDADEDTYQIEKAVWD